MAGLLIFSIFAAIAIIEQNANAQASPNPNLVQRKYKVL
jgi:hypothetical protein